MSISNSNKTKFVPAICKQCGAQIEVDSENEKAFCQYCGTQFIVNKAIETYNIRNARMEHVESVNINKRGAVESVLNFVEKQQDKKQQKIDEEKRRVEEEKRKQEEQMQKVINQLFNKKYRRRNSIIAMIVVIFFITVAALSGTSEQIDRSGQAKTPSGSTIYEGDTYSDVVEEFEENGFINIKLNPIEDLVFGVLTKDGEVESVSVDGDTDYLSNSWYLNDVEVVISYHTFPSKESNIEAEVIKDTLDTHNTQIKETTKVQENTKILEKSNSRNVSGFDLKTNQQITWCGINFFVPEYFDVRDEASTENSTMFYPKEDDYFASLVFESQDFSETNEVFNDLIPNIVESTLESEKFVNAEIHSSKRNVIAGLHGWTISYTHYNDDDEVISRGIDTIVYNINVGKIAIITCIYDSDDQSQYDYLGDHRKTLEMAIVQNENYTKESTEKKIANITIDNNEDFTDLLESSLVDYSVQNAFATKYHGKVVEFDGCTVLMMNHGRFTTRFDVLVYSGDYHEESGNRAPFSFIDVNFFDMNVSGIDTVGEGMDFRVIGKVVGYDDDGHFIELEPVSLQYR